MEYHTPIKIAFLTPEYPHARTPGFCGGIGTSIMNLASGMQAAGAVVSVLVYGQQEDQVFEENGITIYRIKNSQRKKLARYFTQKKIQRLINSLVKHKKVNVVEAPDWRGVTSFINLNCPIVIKLHGSDTYFAHFSKLPLKWRIKYSEGRALRKADALVSVSQYTAEVTKELFGLKKDFTVIPNGIDIRKFPVMPAPANADIILYFGTLVRKKGSLELPLIFNKVIEKKPDAQLVLVGLNSDDPTTKSASVWQMIQDLLAPQALSKVTYAGSVDYIAIKDYIAAASVCVFPSYAEALPVSWIEAMAMGKAVVASNIGWATELIEDGKQGYLADPADHEKFADRIVCLLSDATLKQQLGNAARTKVEDQFSLETVARQNIEFYKRVIAKSKRF